MLKDHSFEVDEERKYEVEKYYLIFLFVKSRTLEN